MLYVNDQKFTLEQMMELHSGAASELPFDAASLKPVQQSVAARWAEVSWPVPTEDGELAADLDYSVYYSAENNLSSVEDILKNGTLAVHSGGMNSTIITGLEPDTAYCVNIIAEDKAGNKTCYQPLTLRTKAEDSWQREGE